MCLEHVWVSMKSTLLTWLLLPLALAATNAPELEDGEQIAVY